MGPFPNIHTKQDANGPKIGSQSIKREQKRVSKGICLGSNNGNIVEFTYKMGYEMYPKIGFKNRSQINAKKGIRNVSIWDPIMGKIHIQQVA